MSRLLGARKAQTLKGKGQPAQTRKSGINSSIITQTSSLGSSKQRVWQEIPVGRMHSIKEPLMLLTGAPGSQMNAFLRVSTNLEKL